MSWLAQVRHVVGKDARHMAWLILATILVIVGSTARALELFGTPEPGFGNAWAFLLRGFSGAPLVAIAGGVLVALLLQSDSSARSDAFWVTRPLAPSAVLGAKVALVVVLLLLLPLGGQLAAFVAHDVPPGRIPSLMLESAVSMAGILGIVAVFAALTPDLRTFLAALLLTTIGWVFGMSFVRSALTADGVVWYGSASLVLPSAVFAVGGVALVAYQYHTRDARRTARVFALPALAAMGLVAIPHGIRPTISKVEAPPALRATRLTVGVRDLQPVRGLAGSHWQASMRFVLADADEAHRYALLDGFATFRLPDGSTIRRPLEGYGPREVFLNEPRFSLPGFTWVGGNARAVGRGGAGAWIAVPDAVAQALRGGGVRIDVEGHVRVQEQRVLSRLPLRAGAAMSSEGRRFRIDRVDAGPTGPQVSATTEAIASRRDAWRNSPEASYDMVAVNAVRKQALALFIRSAGAGMGHDLVLPGPMAQVYQTTVGAVEHVPRPGEPEPVVSDAWMRDAELSITDWVTVGSYPIHVVSDGVRVSR